MRLMASWLLGTAVFAPGMVLADRYFWSQCSGLPTSRYAEVWICANVPAGGLAIVTLAYRPPVAYMPLSVLVAGVASFMIPTAVACVLGARVAGGAWRSSL